MSTPPMGLKPARPNIHEDPRLTPQMKEAAQGLEAMFTQAMVKAMRKTVEPSEFSLNNAGTEIYQGMLDEEYSQKSASMGAAGLSNQILEYWLQTLDSQNYNRNRNLDASKSSEARTGGTDENQSKRLEPDSE